MTAEAANLEINVTANGVDQANAGLERMAVTSGRAASSVQFLGDEARAAMTGLSGITGALGEFSSRASRLKASVDPIGSAMDRVNAEMREADALYKVAAIGASEYANSMAILESRLEAAVGAHNALTMAQMRGSKAAGLTANETLNLSRQMSDVGVSLAMGMNPLMVLIQQGPQIADIMGTASARGVGLSGAMRGLAGAMGPLLPILAAVGAVVGVAAAGLAIFTQQINAAGESADETQKRLGLTDEQMKKVGNTGVTMGDTLKAAFEVAGRAISNALNLDEVWKAIQSGYQAAVDGVFAFARATVGTIGAAVGGIRAVWTQLPAAFGDAMVSAANAVIEIVNRMIDAVLTKIRLVTNLVNGAAAAAGLDRIFGEIKDFDIAPIQNRWAGAGKSALLSFARGALEGRDAAIAGLDSVVSAIIEEARSNADERIRKEAGKAAKTAKGPADARSDAEKETDRIVKASGETAAALEAETKSRRVLNDAVAAGAITYAEANRQLELEKTLHPLLAEADKATGAQKQVLLDIIARLTAATRANNDEAMRGAMIKAAEDRTPQIEALRVEIEMIGQTARARAEALAVLKEEQAWRAQGFKPEGASDAQNAAYQAAIASAREIAGLQVTLKEGQIAFNESLRATADLLVDIDAQAQDAAAGMAKAFGNVGKAMGEVLTLMTGYAAKQEQLNLRRKAEGVTAQQVAKIDREAARDRVGYYGDMIGAAQGFFREGSDGYRALQAAEQAYRAVQFALSVQAMLQKAAETGVSTASDAAGVASHSASASAHMALDAATTTTGIAAGAARIFAALGPYGFPVVAGMLGVMAGLGASSGGGGSAGIPISEQRQKSQGAGSVLGDASAKSESIAKSLEIVASNTNRDLEYSNGMLKALRSIDDQIGTVASALAKSFGVGGMLDTSKLGLGSTANGPSGLQRLFLPLSNLLPGLFGSTTTRKLKDQGVQFGAGTLDQIMSGGLSGNAYQQILETTKKKAFGLTYSESTKTKTSTTPLDGDFLRQTELLIGSLRDGVLAAASTLGITGAEATLAAFKVDLGKLSFKDMTGDEIQQALEGIFGKLADDMAGAVLPGLTDLQKVGEGLFETLTRVARQYQVVDVTLSSIGKTFGLVGVSSLGARERLVDLFGSLDDFTERTAFYAENYLTEAERLAPIQNAVTAELSRLGLAGVKTRDQFKAVVQGLDVSTQAGAELFAALMSLAPAFAKITEETDAIKAARDALSSSYERESGALADTADRFRGLADNLRKFREGLYSGPTAMLSPEAAYQAARATFEQTAGLARTGNETALGDLQSVSQAYLDASKAYYASSAGYFDDLAAVREAVTAAEGTATAQVDVAQAQLDELKALVSGYLTLDQSVLSVRDAVANLTALLGGPSTPAVPSSPVQTNGAQTTAVANDNSADVLAELRALNARLDALLAQNGAIAIEQIAALRDQADLLSRQLREQQAS